MTGPHYDVIVVGAGLVGLALAPALVHAGLTVALVDRADVAMPMSLPAGDGWDARVYAISPGSAAFLRVAWGVAGAARGSHRAGRGDAGGGRRRCAAPFLRVRARRTRARVDRRGARAARGARARGASGGRRDPRSCALDALTWSPDAGTLHCADGTTLTARLIVGADGLRSRVREAAGIAAVTKPYGQTAVVANFNCEHPHLRARLSMVPGRRRHPRLAAAARAPDVDGVVRAGRAGARAARAAGGRARGARRSLRSAHARARSNRSRRARDSRSSCRSCRR